MSSHQLTVFLAGIIVLLVLVLVGLWRVALERIVTLRLERDAANHALGQVGAVADELAEQARLQERRASEFFEIIEGVEKERDVWQRLYRESSQAAGAAQGWLVRDMTRVIQVGNAYAARLKKLGEQAAPVDVDPLLKQLVEDFATTHIPGHPEIVSTDAVTLAKAVGGAPSVPRP